MYNFKPEEQSLLITGFLRDQLSGHKAVIGVSGGVDSALVLALLSRSIPAERIVAVHLPETGKEGTDYQDVMELSKKTGVSIGMIPIGGIADSFYHALGVSDSRAAGNIKSRIRMIILYYLANVNDGLVVGTTNRTEYITGYYTKYGDGACDIEPVMHLLKFQVRELAKFLGVPESIIIKKPSAGLWENQTDEEEIGMSYGEMDESIIRIFDRKEPVSGENERKIMEMYDRSKHKRRMPASLLS
ncbi:MAG: NAD+ synthase [Thermoplasmataceae archaeon]